MESVRNYLLSHKQYQKAQFDKAHGAHDLPELGPRQEVLFWSPVEDEYITRTIVDKSYCAMQLCLRSLRQKVLQNKVMLVANPPSTSPHLQFNSHYPLSLRYP